MICCSSSQAIEELKRCINDGTIIYALSISVANELGRRFLWPVYHRGINPEDRQNIIHGLTEGTIKVVVATSGLGTGLDFQHINILKERLVSLESRSTEPEATLETKRQEFASHMSRTKLVRELRNEIEDLKTELAFKRGLY